MPQWRHVVDIKKIKAHQKLERSGFTSDAAWLAAQGNAAVDSAAKQCMGTVPKDDLALFESLREAADVYSTTAGA
eukprot:12918225-Prorocentrum_lima.AAC.1